MTHVIFLIDENSCLHKQYQKSPDELCREIELGCFESPIPLKHPHAVRMKNYLLVAEREAAPMLSKNQADVLELLSMGASETEISRAMQLSYAGIRHHIDTLKKKFGVTTREELIAIYCRIRN